MRAALLWLTIDDVMAVHEMCLRSDGGLGGIRDAGGLASAMAKPHHLATYGAPDKCDLAAAYADGIVNNHPFVDGNKRAGFVAAALFMEINGLRLTAPEEEVVHMTIGLADKSVRPEGYAAWLRSHSREMRNQR